MARPVSITKDRILAVALDIVRRGGPEALSARNLTAALGCGASPLFASFGSMEGLRQAVLAEAKALYKHRVGAGFSLNPPFKGFGMAFVWFAMDEPRLFRLIMDSAGPSVSLEAYLDAHVGFKDECLQSIGNSLGIRGHDAEMIYYQMLLVALGIAQTCTGGGAHLSLSQVANILGKNMRAFLMVIHAGADEREHFMPKEGAGPEGDIGTYAASGMEDALAGQNHLLQDLHREPRYIRDSEWEELERVLRNTSGLTPDSLQKAHPGLTHGDIRIFILDRLQFSVAEQALLLGISAPSVTKARQRLKSKL